MHVFHFSFRRHLVIPQEHSSSDPGSIYLEGFGPQPSVFAASEDWINLVPPLSRTVFFMFTLKVKPFYRLIDLDLGRRAENRFWGKESKEFWWEKTMRKAAVANTAKTLEKLEKSVQAGKYYEAQQMYKSIHMRYITAQKYGEALDILQSGASVQLKHDQVTCGAELAVLFVETLVKGKYPFCHAKLDRIKSIYADFPQITLPHNLMEDDDDMQKLSEALITARTRVEGCSSFLKAAIRWSAEFGGPRRGSPEMHDMLAEYMYSQSPEPDMMKVSMHFVRGNHPEKFASMLVNFMGKCYPGEDDLAIARAVLMYLSMGNLRDANFLVDEMRKQLTLKQLEFPSTELMSFINYLLQILEREAVPLFKILRQKYKGSIDRESSFDELLDSIAERFYGLQKISGIQGMFGDFFKMMGGEMVA